MKIKKYLRIVTLRIWFDGSGFSYSEVFDYEIVDEIDSLGYCYAIADSLNDGGQDDILFQIDYYDCDNYCVSDCNDDDYDNDDDDSGDDYDADGDGDGDDDDNNDTNNGKGYSCCPDDYGPLCHNDEIWLSDIVSSD